MDNLLPMNSKAWTWTLGVHGLLLLIFFLIRYPLPFVDTPAQELGMEVNLGTQDFGMGQDQPMFRDDPAAEAPVQRQMERGASPAGTRPVYTAEDETAPAVTVPQEGHAGQQPNPSGAAASSNTAASGTGEASSQAEEPRYVYPGATGTGGNQAPGERAGSGEGQGAGMGDQGVAGGTPGADTYRGLPGGGGIGHNLNRRTIVAFPPREADYTEAGTVVVRVTVNRQGDITHHRILSSSHPDLTRIALEKISYIRFNKSPQAPQEQFGNISFRFKTRS